MDRAKPVLKKILSLKINFGKQIRLKINEAHKISENKKNVELIHIRRNQISKKFLNYIREDIQAKFGFW